MRREALLIQGEVGGATVARVGPTAAECDAKLARCRAALEAGADPAVVAGWIAETQAEVNAPSNTANLQPSSRMVSAT